MVQSTWLLYPPSRSYGEFDAAAGLHRQIPNLASLASGSEARQVHMRVRWKGRRGCMDGYPLARTAALHVRQLRSPHGWLVCPLVNAPSSSGLPVVTLARIEFYTFSRLDPVVPVHLAAIQIHVDVVCVDVHVGEDIDRWIRIGP